MLRRVNIMKRRKDTIEKKDEKGGLIAEEKRKCNDERERKKIYDKDEDKIKEMVEESEEEYNAERKQGNKEKKLNK